MGKWRGSRRNWVRGNCDQNMLLEKIIFKYIYITNDEKAALSQLDCGTGGNLDFQHCHRSV